MEFSAIEIWFVVGVILILAEFIIPAIGLLFIGFGALSSSITMYYAPSLIDYQFALVGISSFVWFLILLWPLKKFVYGKRPTAPVAVDRFDMIGMQVEVVTKHIDSKDIGQVLWSGTIMNARLDDTETDAVKVGTKLYIVEVQGNVLICSKKKP